MFDHTVMRKVSERAQAPTAFDSSKADPGLKADLQFVAKTFCELQKKRHAADYDLSIPWEPTDTLANLLKCQRAFETWERIKSEDIAQEYLVTLLIKPRD